MQSKRQVMNWGRGDHTRSCFSSPDSHTSKGKKRECGGEGLDWIGEGESLKMQCESYGGREYRSGDEGGGRRKGGGLRRMQSGGADGGGGVEKNRVRLQRAIVCDTVRSGLQLNDFLKEEEQEDSNLVYSQQ